MLDPLRIPKQNVLTAVPVFPLPNVVLLPGMVVPFNVFEPRYLDLVDYAAREGSCIGVPLLRPGYEASYAERPQIESVFGLGQLLDIQVLRDKRKLIRLEGLGRVRVLEELPARATFREFKVEVLPELHPQKLAALEALKVDFKQVALSLEGYGESLIECLFHIKDSRVFIYSMAMMLPNMEQVIRNQLAQGAAQSQERCDHLNFQQECLCADSADARVELLSQRLALLLGTLRAAKKMRASKFN